MGVCASAWGDREPLLPAGARTRRATGSRAKSGVVSVKEHEEEVVEKQAANIDTEELVSDATETWSGDSIEDATHTSLLGPFFRENAPKREAGSPDRQQCHARHRDARCGARSPTSAASRWPMPGFGLADRRGRPLDIQVDASGDGLSRCLHHRCAGQLRHPHRAPLGYSIPMDGPVGALVQAQGRHGMRPAHIHFLVSAPGYRELVTALYLRATRILPTTSCSARRPILSPRSSRATRPARSRACPACAST